MSSPIDSSKNACYWAQYALASVLLVTAVALGTIAIVRLRGHAGQSFIAKISKETAEILAIISATSFLSATILFANILTNSESSSENQIDGKKLEKSSKDKKPSSSEGPLDFESYYSYKSRTIKMVGLSPFTDNPMYLAAKEKVQRILRQEEACSPEEDRAIAVLLGMVVGDALGAPFEFLPFSQNGYRKPGENRVMRPENFSGYTNICQRFALKPGHWTDDASMGLVLADHLLRHHKIHGGKLMVGFKNWWYHGNHNAFAQGGHGAGEKTSIGLGGNISQAFSLFTEVNVDDEHFVTFAGNKQTSGNGSIMRGSPVAIFATTVKEAVALGRRQSLVTHQGEEAAACAELMAYIIFEAIHSPEADIMTRKNALLDAAFLEKCFIGGDSCGASLAASVTDPVTKENWNWKDPNFTFNPKRAASQPTYIGSFSMDALAMALHCIWTTDSFEEAVLKAATRGGDADSVAAVTAQIAGAIYGSKAIPREWIDAVQQWDRQGENAARGYLLYHAQRAS